MRQALFATVPLFLFVPAAAQVSDAWTATHSPGTVQDVSRAIANDGTRVAVTGSSNMPVVGFPPFQTYPAMQTVVYDTAGNELWSRSFASAIPSDDIAYEVALIPGGGVAVVGDSTSFLGPNPGTRRTALVYSATGTLAYSRVTGNTSTASRGRALAIAANGDVILGGVDGVNAGDLCVERLDNAGAVVWSTIVEGGALGRDFVDDVQVGPGGDVWATGYVATSASGRDLVVMRLSGSTGAVQWMTKFDGGSNLDDYGVKLAVDASGRAFAAGYVNVTGQLENAVIAAFSPTGSILWNPTFKGGALYSDWAFGIAVDPFGRIVAGGTVSTATPTGLDFAAWCFDTTGALVWSATWDGGTGRDEDMSSFGVDALGNVTIVGTSSNASGPVHADSALASWDSQGILAWSHVDQGTGRGAQFGNAVAVTTDLIVYTGPANTSVGGPSEYRTLAFARTATAFCLGDGSATPCPCSNSSASAEQAGCRNSFGVGGRVRAQGTSSLTSDTFALITSAMPNSPCLYFQGTMAIGAGAGAVFGDGLRCAGGTVVRLGTKSNVGGTSQYPSVGDPSVSVGGSIGGAGTRTYQVWYRNSAAFCTTSTFNLSNGLLVNWSV